jgi:hypothetical protein
MFANGNYEPQGREKIINERTQKVFGFPVTRLTHTYIHLFCDSQYVIDLKTQACVTGTSYLILPK